MRTKKVTSGKADSLDMRVPSVKPNKTEAYLENPPNELPKEASEVSGESKAKFKTDAVPAAAPPLLFKVEKILGVHACPYSNRAFIREFMEKYNFQPAQGAGKVAPCPP